MADSLLSGERKAVLLGNAAAQHPQASSLLALSQWIAEQTGATVGYLTEAANTVGAQLVGALPQSNGLNAGQMLSQSLKAYVLLNTEPELDAANPSQALAAVKGAQMVVSLSAFKTAASDYADVLLPIAPFSETSGTFVNAEGRVQSFYGVVKPQGDARPAWKVLRVLGNLLGLQGFDFETSEEVRARALGDVSTLAARLSNKPVAGSLTVAPAGSGLERVSDVPIYAADAIVRRAESLQKTADAKAPVASLPTALWQQLGLSDGAQVRVSQGAASAVLPAVLDAALPANVVRVPTGHAATSTLGAAFGPISVDKA